MSLFAAPIRLTLTPYEMARFNAITASESSGGPALLYLKLLAGFQRSVNGNTLDIEDDDLVTVNRYAYAYGGGGYQNAFRAVITGAKEKWRGVDKVLDNVDGEY
jgi:hypothetical protein